MLDEFIRPADAHNGKSDAEVGEFFQKDAAKAAPESVIFKGDDQLTAAGEKFKRAGVERLGEAGVHHGTGITTRREGRGGFHRHGEGGSVGPEGNLSAVLDDFGLADGKDGGMFLDRLAGTGAARIADGDGAGVRGGGEEHVGKLVFILWGEEEYVRDAPEVRNIEKAVVGRPVIARESSTIHAENDGEILQADVMDDGVECSLKEGGIDGDEGLDSLRGKSGGKEDGVFFRDADVEVFVRVLRAEAVQPGAVGHGAGDGDNA